MLLLTMFIIGHMEIGSGYCRTDMMLGENSVTMEYPCEYFSELRDLDNVLKTVGD